MAAFRAFFWWLALCLAAIFVLSAPGLISRAVLDVTAMRGAQESKDRLKRWTRNQMEILLESRKTKTYSQWTDADRDAYRAMRLALQDLGEEWPEKPAP